MMSSYRHGAANGDGACDVNNNNSNHDHNSNLLTADNLLRLALKKPKSWNWELTTSSSSPNITFPKIQLFDGASGELMVEVDRPDCVIRSGCSDTAPKSGGSSPSRYRRSRTSLVREKLTTTGDSLADIFSQLQNKGLGHKLTTSGSQYRLLQGAQVDESARGSLQKSKSANAIVVTPEAPPIVRRRSRRSLASRSSSILERISEFYGRSSTEEEDVLPAVPQLLLEPASDAGSPGQEEGVTIEELPADDCPAETASKVPPRPKIYKLVRSNIGTLMVREESFHTQRSLRRRQREAGGERVPSPPELVELDEQTDRPRPVPGGTELDRNRYEREISRIDGLLSRVMLSHDLQTEELACGDLGPSIRIEDAPEDVLVREVMNGLSTEHQNGSITRRPRRRSRRSVSVGGSVTSPHRLRSASSSSTSDGEQDRGYRGTRLRGQHRTGSSSRSGSQKRRGRTRHRDPDVGPHATISNGDRLISLAGEPPERQRESFPERAEPTAAAQVKQSPIVSGKTAPKTSNSVPPTAPTGESNEPKPKLNSNGAPSATVSSFLADSYNASDKVLQKLVQSLGRSLNTRKRDRLEAKRKGGTSWLRRVPGCCAGTGKSVSPPARDSLISSQTGGSLRYRNERNRRPCGESDPLLFAAKPDAQPDRQEAASEHLPSRSCDGSLDGTRFLLDLPDVEPAVELTCYHHHDHDDDEDDEDEDEGDDTDQGVIHHNERTCALEHSASERADRNQRTRTNMGANVSSSARQHAKGLTSGRRAQSIDNLKSDTTQYFHQYHNNNNGDTFHQQTFLADGSGVAADGDGLEKQPPPPDLACLPGTGQAVSPEHQLQQQQQQHPDHVIYVSRKDRNKFCGSLPNHLDFDAATIDRDCEAIVKQNEFLQANLKNVQQHQQQQQHAAPPNGALPQQPLTFAGTDQLPTAAAQQLATYQQQQQHDLPLLCTKPAGNTSTTSTAAGTGPGDAVAASTFRTPSEASGTQHPPPPQQQQPPGALQHNLPLKLPLHRTAIDAGCDQGYGSERSPEDELPPPLLLMHETQYIELLTASTAADCLGTAGPVQQQPGDGTQQQQQQQQQPYQPTYWTGGNQVVVGPYSFITKDSIFFVQVSKGSRGLGFSVSGGSDSSAPYPGLIRIKRLFPHQAAWATGMLQPGDILLEANGVPLTGLTNYHALEELRKATNVVTLTVCRPKDEQYRKLSPPTEPPRPPLRNALSYEHGSGSVPQSPLPPAGIPYPQQQQQQQLQHFFPPTGASWNQQVAGFLPPLDPIQTSFSGEFEIIMTKQQGSLGFTLRKEDDSVLGHYVRALVREPALSDGRIRPGDKIVAVNDVPVSSMTHEEAVIFLRQAADVVRLRLYRDQAQTPLSAHSPSDASVRGARTRLILRPEARNLLNDLAASRYHRAAAATTGSGSSVASSSTTTSPRRLRRVGVHQHGVGFDNHGFQQQHHHHSNDTFNYSDSCSNASTIVSQALDNLDEAYYRDEEIDAIVASEEQQQQQQGGEQGPRPRPTFLDLEAGARFQLGGGGATVQQLNQLDRAALDAPLRYGLAGPGTPGLAGPDPDGPNFVSLPCETFLVACKTEQDLQDSDQTEAIYVQHFAHKSPLYSSVNVPSRVGAAELVEAVERGGKKSLMKWKGATLLGEEGEREAPSNPADGGTPDQQDDALATPDADDSSLAATAGTTLSTATPTTERELFDLNASCGTDSEGNQIFTVELNKGWNSRLGFSLQQEPASNGTVRTVISAIYRDSVAARDGRLRVGDILIMVNEESVESLPTAQVIELMRIVRGSIFITLMRPSGGGAAGGTLEPTPEESAGEEERDGAADATPTTQPNGAEPEKGCEGNAPPTVSQ
ncbi:uncharacterized protein LOC121599724 isoform X1 [Anopheles merus]|uniref:uncharacterized protein LOC121599724 isoform X1 n=1 Tax=Anopheles merus TaxID=30066 RepID=UPI001BE4DB42|nr:uncharacterized protein LOC121599724 isoform X1 [Anopheles merus]XP_041783804.1 uncharacterized protein LOC121599724 isoform X1 [Anopheles merus]XP_041783884.1 uncharacterized protein LOC121599724 isoform X1 [Anopheles merus]XP_041783964.1 uncharacterized protein LOC121599724 isoform X1 [Anopheles merus]XP_041784049.1 uncharacterized protein LOC121599724 isoform X1 [Anopheles merus]XP_041784127.1 uncharacterized protein LOC121599724 isoform X1 [Anopheles merus]